MNDATYRLANLVGNALNRALKVDYHLQNAAVIPRQGAAIIACTHSSYVDFMGLLQATQVVKRFPRFMIREAVWQPSWLRPFLTNMQHISVDRQAPAAALLQARRLLNAGELVGIFPEAGISYSYAVRALMPGAAWLASVTGAPIIPVAQWGLQRIHTVGDPEPKPDYSRGRRVDVSFGEPIWVPPGADLIATTTQLGYRLTELLQPPQRLPQHQPKPGESARWHPSYLGGAAISVAAAANFDDLPVGHIPAVWNDSLS